MSGQAVFFYSPFFCDTGRTKSVDWRKEQLRAVDRFETQFSQLSASWTNQDAGWEWGRLHLSVEDRPEQTTPGDNHGRNRLPEVVSFNPKKTFSVNIYIFDAPHARNDIIGLLREIDDWTQDTWGPIFNLFNILLSFSFQFWNPPQIRSQVTFDTAGHCSHPPWTIWGGSRHRWHSLEVLWHLGQLQVLGTTHFSCRLPPCCRPLLLATVSLSNQGEMSCLLLQQSPSSILSEIAPATASAISQLLPKYLDQVGLPPAKEKLMENLKYPGLRQSCGRRSARDHCSLEGDYFPSWILTQLWPSMENSYENTSFSIVLGLHLCAICISCLLVIKLFQPKKSHLSK